VEPLDGRRLFHGVFHAVVGGAHVPSGSVTRLSRTAYPSVTRSQRERRSVSRVEVS
jgi:hypothetical protein